MAPSDKRRLVGKVAIITGSGRGIGRCEALLMAQQGAKIVVSDIGTDTDRTRNEGTHLVRCSCLLVRNGQAE
jgi:3-oxoacyl-[acyl-carrier protein] reductase